MIPLSDSSRRPVEFPAVTIWLIAINVVAFGLELLGGDEFVLAWSVTPAVIGAGRDWLTLLTAVGPLVDMQSGGVAYVAHIAGAVFGAASAGLFSQPRVLEDGGPPWEPTTRFGRHL